MRDKEVWITASVAAGMDLAVSLVEMGWGHNIAQQVARYHVMNMMRTGGQSQFSTHLAAQGAEEPAINTTQDQILQNPSEALTVTALAA